MVSTALFIKLEAKPGREDEVESFLRSGLPIVETEPATTAWFAIGSAHRLTPSSTPSRTKPAAKRI